MRPVRNTFILAAAALAALLAAPAHAAECGALRRVARFDIVPDPGGRPLIPVVLEGRRKHLLVDSGGFSSMLEKATVRELGLRPVSAATSVYTVNGARSSQVVRVAEFLLGPLPVNGHYFWVDPNGEAGRTIAEHEMAGHVGAEILRNFDPDFDFGANVFSLFLQDHCAGAVVHWPAERLAVVPFRLNESLHIALPVTIDGKELTAILDTGAAHTSMNLSVAMALFGVNLNAPDVQRVDEIEGTRRNWLGSENLSSEPVYRRRFQSLAFEGLTVNAPMITLLPDFMGAGGGLPDLILGMSTLSKLHLYIAYKERKLYITEASVPAAIR